MKGMIRIIKISGLILAGLIVCNSLQAKVTIQNKTQYFIEAYVRYLVWIGVSKTMSYPLIAPGEEKTRTKDAACIKRAYHVKAYKDEKGTILVGEKHKKVWDTGAFRRVVVFTKTDSDTGEQVLDLESHGY